MIPRGKRERLEEENGEGHKVEPHICFAVQSNEFSGGDVDEEESQGAIFPTDPFKSAGEAVKGNLQNYAGNRIITTPCLQKDQVIEWLFVPILVPDDVGVEGNTGGGNEGPTGTGVDNDD